MKRIIALSLTLLMISAFALTACSPAAPATGSTKHGLGTIIRMDKSVAAGEKDGLAQVDAVVSSVVIDSAGKIVDVKLDSIQQKVNFAKDGTLKTDVKALGRTKRELGTEYNMKAASKLGKEWFEQADALQTEMKGKTKADLQAWIGKIDKTSGQLSDIISKVTIKPNDYLEATIKAIDNAR